jgi:ketosteroid isomerase-like protein
MTTEANPNKQLLLAVFAGLAKGDPKPFVDSLADDFCWNPHRHHRVRVPRQRDDESRCHLFLHALAVLAQQRLRVASVALPSRTCRA